MKAAIAALQSALFIRQLQERELSHCQPDAARVSAIVNDIAEIERGLALLRAAQAEAQNG